MSWPFLFAREAAANGFFFGLTARIGSDTITYKSSLQENNIRKVCFVLSQLGLSASAAAAAAALKFGQKRECERVIKLMQLLRNDEQQLANFCKQKSENVLRPSITFVFEFAFKC